MPQDENQIPTVPDPVGSQAEVGEMDPDLLMGVATCSQPRRRDGSNMGCEKWKQCDFAWKGTRPRNVIVEQNKKGLPQRVTAMPCYLALRRRDDIHENKGYVRFLGSDGDEYEMRETQRLHPKMVPDCPDCAKAQCNTMEDVKAKRVCEPFPPAREHPALKLYADAMKMKQDRQRDESVNRENLFFGTNQPVAPVVTEEAHGKDAEPEGSGPGGGGERSTRTNQPTQAQG